MFLKKFMIYLSVVLTISLLNSCDKNPEKEIKPVYQLKKNQNIPKFNSDNAYNQIAAQVILGPRNPGSRGHQAALFYFEKELSMYADTVIVQNFSYPGYDNTTLNLSNIIAKFNPGEKQRILLCAHWDTRPRAEHAFDTTKRDQPILGANDGASGCGVLLELARLLKNNKVDYGIDLVFFDGEDYGKENDLNNFCLGSKYYAAKNSLDDVPVFGILLDLVGDKKAVFNREGSSNKYASNVVDLIWGIAQQLNAKVFSQTAGGAIYDDHIPLNQAGIVTADIIDEDLVGANNPDKSRNYWHSEKDNMENISKETLQQLGNVITYLIYSIHFNS